MGDDGYSNAATAGVSSGHLESELENACREIALVEVKIHELLEAKSSLVARRDQLSVEIQARKKRRKYIGVSVC